MCDLNIPCTRMETSVSSFRNWGVTIIQLEIQFNYEICSNQFEFGSNLGFG
jgi:hypothetical protein